MCKHKYSSYLKEGRLADVLALIQVLAIDKYCQKNEEHIIKALQGKPRSSGSWISVAKLHPEFFRVKKENKNPISLLKRYVTEEIGPKKRDPFSAEDTSELCRLAIELYDREVNRSQWWHPWLPVLTAILAALLGVFLKS
ncbi:MAG TPA: hypothetical protein PKJ62_07360 [Bacteroidia bacterium]|nr:hypothetical protein [Bacteroidia bacterium]